MSAPRSATDELSRSIAPGGLPETPPCPFCEGIRTELQSAFGSQLSVATYWCIDCRSPFEFMKWGGGASTGPGDRGPAGAPPG